MRECIRRMEMNSFSYSQSSKIISSSGTLLEEDDPDLTTCFNDLRAIFFCFEELTTMRSSSESSMPITSFPFISSSRNTSLTRIIKSKKKIFYEKAKYYRDKDPTDSLDRRAWLWLSKDVLLPVCTSRAELRESLILPVHGCAALLE